MDSLRVLRQAPSFYMEVEGPRGLPAQVGLQLEHVARRLVPQLTGGVFQVARWETGPTPRPPQPGWIMIERSDLNGFCGEALIGALAGRIWLDNDSACRIDATFAHELGHALGFWHVDVPDALMFPRQRASNVNDTPTPRELHHAAIAYRRLPGNRDIDVDPQTSSTLAPRLIVE